MLNRTDFRVTEFDAGMDVVGRVQARADELTEAVAEFTGRHGRAAVDDAFGDNVVNFRRRQASQEEAAELLEQIEGALALVHALQRARR